MKKFFKAMILALTVMFVATSCTTFRAENLAFGAAVSGNNLGTFEKTITVWKFLGTSGGPTLFNISQDASCDKISNAIRNEVEGMGGNAAVNVTIEQKCSFVNMIVNSITGHILAPTKIIIKGTAVRV